MLRNFLLLFLFATNSVFSQTNEEAQAWADVLKADTLFSMDKDEEAIQLGLSAAKKLKNKNKYRYAFAIKQVAKVYISRQETDKALPLLMEALHLCESSKFTDLLPNCTSLLGAIYLQNRNYTKAQEYYEICEKASKATGNPEDLAKVFNNLGMLYVNLKKFEEAENYHLQALTIKKQLKQDVLVAQAYSNLSEMRGKMKDYEKSLEYNDSALFYSKKAQSKYGMILCYVNRSYALLNLKKFKEASQSKDSAKVLISTSKNFALNSALAHLQMRIFEVQEKFDSAFYYQNQMMIFDDSLAQMKATNLLAEMEAKYQNAKKETKIQQQKNDLVLQKEKLEAEKKFNLTLIAGLLVFVALAYLLYNRYRAKQKLKLEYKLLETEHKALQLQMNPHFIFSVMNSIKNYIRNSDIDQAQEKLVEFSDLMRCVLNSSREKTISLAEEITGLKAYLSLNSSILNNKFHYAVDAGDLDAENLAVPPMLLQPLVENAIKHGIEPKEERGIISIHFSKENDLLKCVIEDNGAGRKEFNTSKKSHSLDIIKERLEALNGKNAQNILIEDLEKGTRVIVYFPVKSYWD